MGILVKIAFRNIVANKRRSLLIGLAIFLSTLLLLISNFAMNGVESQVLRGYINLQSGQVAVMWENLKKTSNMSPGRFINTMESISFDVDKDQENKQALDHLSQFLKENQNEVQAFYPTIRRNAELVTSRKVDSIIIYSLTPDNRDFILKTKTLAMEEGELLAAPNYSICISKEKAADNNLSLGDVISIEVTTPYGAKNAIDFVIGGIYANGASYDNWYGFVTQDNARELFDMDPSYFDIGRIYLKDPRKAPVLAKKLDAFLQSKSPVLRAESCEEASPFYFNMSKNSKMFFNVFVFFLLVLIAIGLRSSVRMNLFERMKEFGTIRAIGFSRPQSFLIIFFEVFFLSTMALALALLGAALFAVVFGAIGVYVGPGDMSRALGGERFYPSMKIGDIVLALVLIFAFSLISTLNPGLKLCYQKITDILVKRQKRISPTGVIIRDFFKRVAGLFAKRASNPVNQ